jgi:HK97 family phage prohead protease
MYQIKSFEGKAQDVDLKQGIITSYWSTFDVIDSDNDIIERTAFNKTISERGPKGSNRIMFLWQHNPTMPLGKPMELYTDSKGLIGVTKIVDTSYGADALKLYESGVINEHSIGFNVIKESYDEQRKANRIQEVKLWEGSAVTWGANEFTPVISGKSELTDRSKAVEYYDTLCKAFYSGTFTDDTFHILEAQKKHIETLLSASLDAKQEPAQSTPTVDVQAEQLKQLFQQFELNETLRRYQNG